MGNENMPLAGIRVIELSSFISVATTARFFANMGADVIKVEPERGDPERYGAVGENISSDPLENTTWELENGNKRKVYDIVTESFQTKTADEWEKILT
ncbi:MAG: CoA transferase, partial [Candidatus Ventricola sp.]|nr:CoA transferase [Candidatus Ventricola sp.]